MVYEINQTQIISWKCTILAVACTTGTSSIQVLADLTPQMNEALR